MLVETGSLVNDCSVVEVNVEFSNLEWHFYQRVGQSEIAVQKYLDNI